MEPREQELMAQLQEANTTLQYARTALADAKRKWVEAETHVINAKLTVEKITEALRVVKSQQVVPDEKYDLYDDEG